MNTNSIHVTLKDLETINKIVQENDIRHFTLLSKSESGIGHTTDMEFEFTLNGREVVVTVNIANEDNW